jgi:hypothetical protein
VVETLQDWWFIIGFTTLKPIIQRFQSFLFILIFPNLQMGFRLHCFRENRMGFCLQLEGWVLASIDESSRYE